MSSRKHRTIGSVLGLFLVLILALMWQTSLGSDIALAQEGGPYSIWDDATTPTTESVKDPNAVELGVKFQSEDVGYISGIRFYKGIDNDGDHIGNLWTNGGVLLATATFNNETASGWQQVNFCTPAAIDANTTYVASYHTTSGNYAFDGGYFATSGVDNPPLHALANGVNGGNGVFLYSATSAFPTNSVNAANYWVDVVFDTSITPDPTPPTVSMTNPADGAVVSGTVSVTADAADDVCVAGVHFLLDGANLGAEDTEAPYTVDWDSVTAANGPHQLTAVVRDGAGNSTISVVNVTVDNPVDTTPPTVSLTSPTEGSEVTGSVTVSADAADNVGVVGVQFLLDGANLGAEDTDAPYTMEWDSATAANGPHTLTALARDAAGNTASSEVSVTVVPLGDNCPCSIWDDTDTPATASVNDVQAIEVGVKFQSDIDGYITGVRFYKGSLNTGTHIGNLWSSDGTLLGTATFVDETDSGWQQVSFDAPVSVAANTTYVASYHTEVGYYSASGGYFATSGEDSPPLHALANGVDGPNGVYAYSSESTFPTDSFNATNYWVDVVFAVPDTTPPTVSMTNPADGAEVSLTVTISANATDNVGVAGVQFLLDGANLGAEDTAPPYTMEWDSTTVADGVHELAAVARDEAGNTTTSSPVSVTVDNNTIPTVTITAPADGATFNEGDTMNFSGTASDAEDGDLTAGLSWTSSIDGFIGSGGSFSRSDLSVGQHTLTASVTDSGGLTGSADVDITIDDVAPVINLEKSSDKKYVLTTGEEVVYTVSIRNDSVTTDPVEITSIMDDIYDDVLNANPNILSTDCTTAGIPPGETYTCSFKVLLQTDALGDHTNIVTVTAADDEDTAATGTDDATVTILPPNQVTNGAYCITDRDPDTAQREFRLLFTPDLPNYPAFKLVASNPGQFAYNVFHTGSGETTTINVTFPYPFVTKGSTAVKAYSDVSVYRNDNGEQCFLPEGDAMPLTGSVSLEDYEIYGSPGDPNDSVMLSFADVPVDPDTGLVFLSVHVDYGLKNLDADANGDGTPDRYDKSGRFVDGNTLYDAVDYSNPTETLIADRDAYTFGFILGDDQNSDTIVNQNEFKETPGVAGFVFEFDDLGNLVVYTSEDLTVRLVIPNSVDDPRPYLEVTPDEDGWYMLNYKHIGKPTNYIFEVYRDVDGEEELLVEKTVRLKGNEFKEVHIYLDQGAEPPPTTDSHYVSDLSGSSKLVRKSWNATVLVTILDQLDNLVPNAQVSGIWTMNGSETPTSCVTDETGICNVTLNKIDTGISSVSLRITDVFVDGSIYDANGSFTEIIVSQPQQ